MLMRIISGEELRLWPQHPRSFSKNICNCGCTYSKFGILCVQLSIIFSQNSSFKKRRAKASSHVIWIRTIFSQGFSCLVLIKFCAPFHASKQLSLGFFISPFSQFLRFAEQEKTLPRFIIVGHWYLKRCTRPNFGFCRYLRRTIISGAKIALGGEGFAPRLQRFDFGFDLTNA